MHISNLCSRSLAHSHTLVVELRFSSMYIYLVSVEMISLYLYITLKTNFCIVPLPLHAISSWVAYISGNYKSLGKKFVFLSIPLCSWRRKFLEYYPLYRLSLAWNNDRLSIYPSFAGGCSAHVTHVFIISCRYSHGYIAMNPHLIAIRAVKLEHLSRGVFGAWVRAYVT